MSLTAFKQQVSHLLSAITSSLDLCNTIRQNRKLGPTTTALDTLQTTLSSDLANIQATYTTLRKLVGSRMDLGDEAARMSMNACIRNVQENIESRLDNLAYKRKEKDGKEKKPGFGDMTRRWQDIEQEVLATLEGLGERIENERVVEISPPSTPKRPEQQQQQQQHYYMQHPGAGRDHERPHQPPPQQQQHKSDEVVISLKQFDHFVQHMKNSWVEKIVDGNILYINVFDAKVTQWERPSTENAFIRSLPAQQQKPKASKGRKVQVEDEEDESEVESRRRREKRDRERDEKEKEKSKREREKRENIDRERERERELREFLERERRERELVEREMRERESREKDLREREEEYREKLRRQQLHQQQAHAQAQAHAQQQGRRPGPPGGWEHGRGW